MSSVHLDGINESSYEKFFFNWAAGEIDAVIMPESFYEYCRTQNGEFMELSDICGQAVTGAGQILYTDHRRAVGIYAAQTRLAGSLQSSADDPHILVFPKERKHKEACAELIKYVLGQ